MDSRCLRIPPLHIVFFFQAEDGIRALVRSRGLGDVDKRQALEAEVMAHGGWVAPGNPRVREYLAREVLDGAMPVSYVARNHGIPLSLSLIHLSEPPRPY